MNNLLEAVPSGSVTPDDLLRMGSKGKQFELESRPSGVMGPVLPVNGVK